MIRTFATGTTARRTITVRTGALRMIALRTIAFRTIAFRASATVASIVLCAACSQAGDGAGKPGVSVNIGTSTPPSHEIQYIKATSGPVRPFSPAVRANGFLILSGQIGTDSAGTVVTGGIVPETKQTMENIKRVLEQNGSSMDQVVKCTVFMADMKEWATMNEVYVTFFNEARRPARSAMGATGLALNARVEIECLAAEK
ncbi:MAG: RidA family protein [Gemmatimonadaceae bacterium]